jgi:hypothetical protein
MPGATCCDIIPFVSGAACCICALAASAVCVSCLGLQAGWTALHNASFQGNQGIVQVLVGQGADLEAKAIVSSSQRYVRRCYSPEGA